MTAQEPVRMELAGKKQVEGYDKRRLNMCRRFFRQCKQVSPLNPLKVKRQVKPAVQIA